MSGVWQLAVGLGLAVAGWAIPRRVAGARRIGWVAMLDAAPLAVVALVLLVAAGRPVFAGSLAFALGAGFAFADRTVRNTLREPVVFTALSELPHIFTHPHLYLPFAGTGLVIGGAAGAVLAAAGLLIAEPPVAAPHPLAASAIAAIVAVLLTATGREPWLGSACCAGSDRAASRLPTPLGLGRWQC